MANGTPTNAPSGEQNSSIVAIVAIVILLVLGALFVVYALPLLQGQSTPTPPPSQGIQVDVTNPLPQPPEPARPAQPAPRY